MKCPKFKVARDRDEKTFTYISIDMLHLTSYTNHLFQSGVVSLELWESQVINKSVLNLMYTYPKQLLIAHYRKYFLQKHIDIAKTLPQATMYVIITWNTILAQL